MRINQFHVLSYGPLSDVGISDVGNFTLVFGENESGKTLMLDAILRFILTKEKDRSLFYRLDRVESDPSGYVDISIGENTIRFPEKGSLPDFLKINALDLRNILVVRASDLQVHGGLDKDYYASITDQLLGIHREPIQKLCSRLQKLGRLTGAGRLSNSQEHEYIGSRIETANELIKQIEQFREENREDMVSMESEIFELSELRERALLEIDLLVQAKNRDKFQDGSDLLSQLLESQTRIHEAPDVSQEDYNRWRESENSVSRFTEDLEKATMELENRTSIRESKGLELEKIAEDLEKLLHKKTAIDEIIKSADRYRDQLGSLHSFRSLKELLPWGFGVTSFLLAMSLIGLILNANLSIFLYSSILFGIIFLLCSTLLVVFRYFDGARIKAWERLHLSAAEHSLNAENLEELLASLKLYESTLAEVESRQHKARTSIEVADVQVRNLTETVDNLRRKIKDEEKILIEIKTKTQLGSLEEIKQIIDEIARLIKHCDSLQTRLAERFGDVEGTLKEKIEGWQSRIAELALFEGAAPGLKYEKSKEDALNKQIADLEEKLQKNHQEISVNQNKITRIGNDANHVLLSKNPLPSETSEDLVEIENELRDIVDRINKEATVARTAIALLEEIQKHEEEKTRELFGENDFASKCFQAITYGKYLNVEYEPSEGELFVVNHKGEKLRAYQLSSGTFDQLYLATRLSLAHRLLQEERGFLLLDDPFLTSDTNRLLRQLEVLLKLAQTGWQIIYFSVKDEIRTALNKAIKAKEVVVLEMKSIHE